MTEEDWQKCKSGDRKIQRSTFDDLAPIVFKTIKRYISDQYEAEDILVESFCKAFIRIEECRESGSFLFWIKRIAVNQALMSIRKSKTKFVFAELPENCSIEYQETNDDRELLLKHLDKAVSLLPFGCKTIVELYYYEDFSHAEIAEKLNISIHTSKSQLAFAKQKLKDFLKGAK